MKPTMKMFAILVVFFAAMGTIYGVWSKWAEPVGSVALYLSAGLAGMIAYYIWFTSRRIGLSPDDDPLGTIGQYEGDFGFFSPYSWTPLWLGASAGLCFAGLAIGWWLFCVGAGFGIVALVLWTFEYFSGEHAL